MHLFGWNFVHKNSAGQTDRQTHTQTNCSENITPPQFRGGVKRVDHLLYRGESAVAQRLELLFPLLGILGSNPIWSRILGDSGMKLISTSRVLSEHLDFLLPCNNGIGQIAKI